MLIVVEYLRISKMKKRKFRQFVQIRAFRALVLGAVVLFLVLFSSSATAEERPQRKIKQSVAYWGWQPYFPKIEDFIQKIQDHRLGIDVELVGLFYKGEELRKVFELLAENDMKDTCHYPYPEIDAFNTGLNDPNHHIMILESLIQGIDICDEFGFPNVIAFAGLRNGMSDEVAIRNIVTALKKSKYLKYVEDCKVILTKDGNGNLVEKGDISIVEYAEMMGVNIVFELLNSKIDVPMKGHPGYQGDNTKFCMKVVRKVNSPNFLLLYDIYHAGIMGEDIIDDILTYIDYIGHFHTAGTNGRHEIDKDPNINYRTIMKLIAELEQYKGHVTHEFIPKGHPVSLDPAPDPFGSLVNAVKLCNVK
jgi:hydroxypyruvate isomerase